MHLNLHGQYTYIKMKNAFIISIYTTYILHDCVIKSTVTWIYFVHTVYRAIFALCNFCPSCTSLTVSPRLELVQTHLCLKRENMSYWNLPSPKFARWQREWKDKNKRRKYFPVYSIYILYTEWAWSRSIFPYTCKYSHLPCCNCSPVHV